MINAKPRLYLKLTEIKTVTRVYEEPQYYIFTINYRLCILLYKNFKKKLLSFKLSKYNYYPILFYSIYTNTKNIL